MNEDSKAEPDVNVEGGDKAGAPDRNMLGRLAAALGNALARLTSHFENDSLRLLRFIALSIAVAATILAVPIGAYLISAHFPAFRVFNALILMAGAALAFAYGVTSKNSVVHVAGFLVIATLVVSEESVVRFWQMAFGDSEIEEADSNKSTFNDINLRSTPEIAGRVAETLYEAGHLSALQREDDYARAISCMLETEDLRRLQSEVRRNGQGQYLFGLYRLGTNRTSFRQTFSADDLTQLNYMRMNELIEFRHAGDLRSACLTARGCEVVRLLDPDLDQSKSCQQLFPPHSCSQGLPDTNEASPAPPRRSERTTFAGRDNMEACRQQHLGAAPILFAQESYGYDIDFSTFLSPPALGSGLDLFLGELSAENPVLQDTVEVVQGFDRPGEYVGRWITVAIDHQLEQQGRNWFLEINLESVRESAEDSNSQPLDPYLFVLDAEGNLIAEDDDGGGRLNAQVRIPTQGGTTVLIGASEYMLRSGQMIVRAQLVEMTFGSRQ